MRSEKILLLLAGGLMLAGCSDNNASSVSLSELPTEAVETTAAGDSTENYILSADENGATMLVNGKPKGGVNFDPPIRDGEKVLSVDINFDGYDDIFACVDYYRADCWIYDHETEGFVKAGEGLPMAFAYDKSMSYSVTYETDSSEKTVTVIQTISSSEGSTVYKWLGDKLVPCSMSVRHYTDEGGPFVDNYIFDDKFRKVLDVRQLIDYRTGECIKTEKDVEYFRVTDSSVDYMKGAELLQSIEVQGLPELCGRLLAGDKSINYVIRGLYHMAVPEDYFICQDDFDFDGHGDLAIFTGYTEESGGEKNLYYRYDTESSSYIPCEDLNRFGEYQLYALTDTKEISYYKDFSADKENDQYILTWSDGSLKLTQRRHYTKTRGMYKLYEYDAQGNESYVKDVVLPTGTY